MQFSSFLSCVIQCGFIVFSHLMLFCFSFYTNFHIKQHIAELPQLYLARFISLSTQWLPDCLIKSVFSEATEAWPVSLQIHSYGGPVKYTFYGNTALQLHSLISIRRLGVTLHSASSSTLPYGLSALLRRYLAKLLQKVKYQVRGLCQNCIYANCSFSLLLPPHPSHTPLLLTLSFLPLFLSH